MTINSMEFFLSLNLLGAISTILLCSDFDGINIISTNISVFSNFIRTKL
jgi:hypothetical protein